MAEVLEWTDEDFLKSIINMLEFLLEKVDNMQQYMGNGSREVESQYR